MKQLTNLKNWLKSFTFEDKRVIAIAFALGFIAGLVAS